MTPERLHLHCLQGQGPAAAMGRAALLLGVPLWRLGLAWDRRRKIARRRTLHRPTVSVGNLAMGGTGKTPAVVWLVQELREAGHRPAVLTRGHGARRGLEADEVLVLRDALGPEVPIHADPDRHAGAAAVLAADVHVSCFVLDDAFQRVDVARELDLVLVDASRPLQLARVFPAGLLREPPAALRRADAVLLTHVDHVPPAGLVEVVAWVRRWHGRAPAAGFAHRWTALWRHDPGADPRAALPLEPIETLSGRRVHAAAGIGHPQAFARQLTDAGALLTGSSELRDHQRLDSRGLRALHAAAAAQGACALVTTAKDWVKWRQMDAGPAALPVLIPQLSVVPLQGVRTLRELLRERLASPGMPPQRGVA